MIISVHSNAKVAMTQALLNYLGMDSLRSLDRSSHERLGADQDSWDAVDTFACFLYGPCWREKQISAEDVHEWAASNNRWWRRSALVSTVPLNNNARGGSGDPMRTLATCKLLLNDRDGRVVKAMSWALRVVREVSNKLNTGLKNPRR